MKEGILPFITVIRNIFKWYYKIVNSMEKWRGQAERVGECVKFQYSILKYPIY